MSKWYLCFIILSSVFVEARSQDITFDFENFNTENGLLNNKIHGIYRDTEGFTWIATAGGLQKFDGYRFTNFIHSQSDTSSIVDNNIRMVFEGEEGKIWIGTGGGGFVKYDKTINRFEQVTIEGHPNLSAKTHRSFIDNDKNIWLGVEKKEFEYVKIDSLNNVSYFNVQQGRTYYSKEENSIYIVRSNSIERIELSTFKESKIHFRKKYKEIDRLSVSYGYKQTLWLASSNMVYLLNLESGRILSIVDYFKNKGLGVTKEDFNWITNPQSLYIDLEENLWVAADNKIYHVDLKTGYWSVHNYITNDELNPARIKFIYGDQCGTIWVVYVNHGYSRVNLHTKKFKHFKKDSRKSNTLASNIIRCLHADNQNIWIGTTDKGLSSYNFKTKKFYRHPLVGDEIQSDTKYQIRSILIDDSKRLWICSGSTNKVFYSDNHTTTPGKVSFNHYEVDGPKHIYQDNNGRIWLGTFNGLYYFDNENDGFFLYNSNITFNINCLQFEEPNILWIGKWRGGLVKLVINSDENYSDLESQDSITAYVSEKNIPNSLPDNRVNELFLDDNNILWIATRSGGLVKKVEEKNTTGFISYNQSNGLFDNTVYGILSDKHKNLWLSTNNGLCRFNPYSGEIKNYTKSDGIQSNIFLEGSAFQMNDSNLFFGGNNGFNQFNPDEIKDNKKKPITYINEFSVLGIKVKPSTKINGREILKNDIMYSDEVTLTHREHYFTIGFSVLDVANPREVRYAYQLSGLNNTWIEVDPSQRQVSFNGLTPGKYTFKVKAANSDGVWNQDSTTLTLNLLPPWWKTNWFRFLFVLSLVTFSFSIIIVRVRKVKAYQHMLERKVKERTHDLLETNKTLKERQGEILTQKEEIESHKNKLEEYKEHLEAIVEERTRDLTIAKEKAEESDKLKTSFLANMSHEIRTPMNAIVGFSSLLSDDGLSKEEKVRYSEQVQQGCDSLLSLISDIIDISQLESGKLKVKNSLFDCHTFLHDIYKSVQTDTRLISNNPKELILNLSSDTKEININTDQDRIKQVLLSLLDNAIKFTEEGIIELGCKFNADSGKVILYVKDTGIGIPEENLNIIFDRFRKMEDNKLKLYRGTGLGLYLSKKLTDALGGEIGVHSIEGKGSEFYIKLPQSSNDKSSLNHNQTSLSIETDLDWSDKTILIVEDEILNYTVSKEILANTKINILWAKDGEKAIQLFKEEYSIIDLILMDIKMPVLNGIEATKIIRSIDAGIPIIAVSAYTISGEEQEALDAGCILYLTKPVKKEVLVNELSKFF